LARLGKGLLPGPNPAGDGAGSADVYILAERENGDNISL